MTIEISIKHHLYEVQRPKNDPNNESIIDILTKLHDEQDFRRRSRPVGGYPVRMENLVRQTDGTYIADFCKIRHIGPGKAPPDGQTVSFELNTDKGEGFGETVGLLVSMDGNHAIVQYNHYGIKASGIAHYLTQYLAGRGKILFAPVPKENIASELDDASSVGYLEVKLDVSNGSASDLYKNKSMTPMDHMIETIGLLDRENATKIKVEISKSRGNQKGIDIKSSKKFLSDVLALSEKNIVTHAKVGARYTDGSSEMLDLLNAKEELILIGKIANKQTRIEFKQIEKMLIDAYSYWSKKGKI